MQSLSEDSRGRARRGNAADLGRLDINVNEASNSSRRPTAASRVCARFWDSAKATNGSWVPHLRSSRAQKPNQGRPVVAFHSAREGTANASPAPVDHAWAATILIYGATGYTGKLIAKSTVRSGSNAADLRLLPELQLLAQSPRCAYYRFPVHTERSRGAPAFSAAVRTSLMRLRASLSHGGSRTLIFAGLTPRLLSLQTGVLLGEREHA